MRKVLIIFPLAIIFFLNMLGIKESYAEIKEEIMEGTIVISGAWALYPMAVKWAEEFGKINPNVKIDVAAGGAGKGMADALAGVVDIGMVSREIHPAEIEKGAWWVIVAKDAVVATANEHNPVLQDLLARGINKDAFIGIWITGEIKNWDEAIGRRVSQPIHIYTRSDACGAAQTWAAFLGNKEQEDLLGIGVYGDPGLAEAVRQDILGIGYNNINYAYDTKNKEQIKGIKILPIDTNGNGQIDKEENFYDTRDELVAAINTGKYPSPPARDLYFVSRGKPGRKAVIGFMKWVLTAGQKYIPEAGYVNLSENRLQGELKKLLSPGG